MYLLKDNNSTELNDIINNNSSVILYFTANWCGPCKKISGSFEKYSNIFNNIKFIKIDIDENSDIANLYKINSIPHFVLIKNKKIIKSFSTINDGELVSHLNIL